MGSRDNFKAAVKKTMAERVAWRCSFPGCGAVTIGPKKGDVNKSVNLGHAAHICAAAENGPRYDLDMSTAYRTSIENGIWMCSRHATLIDQDYTEYSVQTLKLWKSQAEELAYKNLVYGNDEPFEVNSTLISIGFNIIFYGHWLVVSDQQWKFSVENFIMGSEQDLFEFVSNFECQNNNNKFVIVESQGDARLIEKIALNTPKNGDIQVSIDITNKLKPTKPSDVGMDLFLGSDGDICFESGDFKVVSGVDAAIQHITTSTSTIYGEWYGDPTMGSYVSKYYNEYKNELDLLSSLFKIEFIRLSLIPTFSDDGDCEPPALSFVQRFDDVTIESGSLDNHRVAVKVALEWGDGVRWMGTVPIWVE